MKPRSPYIIGASLALHIALTVRHAKRDNYRRTLFYMMGIGQDIQEAAEGLRYLMFENRMRLEMDRARGHAEVNVLYQSSPYISASSEQTAYALGVANGIAYAMGDLEQRPMDGAVYVSSLN